MNERVPNAVRSSASFAGAGDSRTKIAKLHWAFSQVLHAERIYVRLQGAEHFISASPHDALNYASRDERAGQPRYDWEPKDSGIYYGYLKE
jgi:hypothetical protein